MLLNKKDFSFEPFAHEGDSGDMYLATKKSDSKKYIVKHYYSDCACNEFVYFSIAKELGLKVLDFNLFAKDKNRQIFASSYAIGIEYIEARKFDNILLQKETIHNWQDYFSHLALFGAFQECDSFEMLCDKNDIIYRIDTTAAFIDNFFTDFAENPIGQEQIRKLAINMEDYLFSSGIEVMGEIIKKEYGTYEYSIYCKTLKLLSELSSKVIEEILDKLCLVYPKVMKEFYTIFLERTKEACKEYLISSNYNKS